MSAVRSKTTSIRRPRERPAADEGRSRLGDLTRPIPTERRISRRPQVAMFAGVFALFVVLTIGIAVFVLPIGTWRGQEQDLEQRQAQLDELSRVNGDLAAEVERLETDEGVREAAGEEIGYLSPGERRLSVLPLPELPTDLPDGWPYNVAEQILDARRARPAADGSD
jgi:cell division protein FtsB